MYAYAYIDIAPARFVVAHKGIHYLRIASITLARDCRGSADADCDRARDPGEHHPGDISIGRLISFPCLPIVRDGAHKKSSARARARARA